MPDYLRQAQEYTFEPRPIKVYPNQVMRMPDTSDQSLQVIQDAATQNQFASQVDASTIYEATLGVLGIEDVELLDGTTKDNPTIARILTGSALFALMGSDSPAPWAIKATAIPSGTFSTPAPILVLVSYLIVTYVPGATLTLKRDQYGASLVWE